MLKKFTTILIRRAERKLGVSPAIAHHTARLRGAIAADCGTCVKAEINLAQQAGISRQIVANIIAARYDLLFSIKRAMGYATTCDLGIMQKLAKA